LGVNIIYKKVFLDNLPKCENRNNCIDWKNSIGHKVKFIYNTINDSIEDEIEIIEYIDNKTEKSRNKRLTIKYRDNSKEMATGQFTRCEIGVLLNKISHEHTYPIGSIINDVNSGVLEIKELITIGKKKYKGYKYRCQICGNEDKVTESNLKQGVGCNVCAHKKVLKGYNDLWTTHPHIAKFLKNANDGYLTSSGCNKKYLFKCPDCGHERSITINDVTSDGYTCTVCSDGIPFPEKFMSKVLKQLNINFEREKSFNWSKNKRYDFYIESLNCIIETHGKQHYYDSFNWGNRIREYKDEKENDDLKEKLANDNNINHYIIIDAKFSETKYIKDNIISSKLNELFDLNTINWRDCEEFAFSNMIKQVCDKWREGANITILKDTFNITRSCIRNYLKHGTELGWCDYDPKLNNLNPNSKKVICLNTGDVYHSIWEASKHCNCSDQLINRFCNGLSFFSDEVFEGEYLQWQFYDEYLINPKTIINKENIDILKHKKMHKMSVICLTTGEIFESIKDASEWCGLKTSAGICSCCKENQKSAGKHPITGEYLTWSYNRIKLED